MHITEARLFKSGADVILIARGEHADVMREHGLSVASHWGDYVVHPRIALMPEEAGVADMVLHCVKLYSNTDTIPTMAPMVGEETVILTVQNGITGGESLAAAFGWERVLEGATYIETSIAAPGRIVQSGSTARIEFGERDGSVSERVEKVRDALSVPGIQVDVSSDIRASLWSKMVAIGALGTVVTAARASLPEVLAMGEGEKHHPDRYGGDRGEAARRKASGSRTASSTPRWRMPSLKPTSFNHRSNRTLTAEASWSWTTSSVRRSDWVVRRVYRCRPALHW